MSQSEKFKYSISKQNGILVAAFSGILAFETTADLEECTKQIFADPGIQFIAIDFSHVGNITMDAIPAFIQLQRNARNHNQEIRLCGMGEELREKLMKLGVIRYRELSPNLKEALILATQLVKLSEAAKKAC